MAKDVIVALDFVDRQSTFDFLAAFRGQSLFLKVGLALYLQAGKSIVEELQAQGHQIFLDLKLHDIPNTVYETARGLASLKVDLITIHAAGGYEMMQAAKAGFSDGDSKKTQIIAVTQLTSTSEHQMQSEQLVSTTLTASVLHYAALAKKAGLAGVVSSVFETNAIKEQCGATFLSVTPGIRLSNNPIGDQKRIATPQAAHKAAVDYIVVGRPITKSSTPVTSYHQIVQAFKGGE